MRLNRDWLRCVMFLCVDKHIDHDVKRVPIATGFLVRVSDIDDKTISWKYVITARHVIENVKNDPIYIRVNLTEGGYMEFSTNRSDWLTHDDADVAAIDFAPPVEKLNKIDHLTIPLDMFVTEDYGYCGSPLPSDGSIKAWVHIGDEIFFIGLFTAHTGKGRNLPIVRFGHISAMPTEPITLPRPYGIAEFETLAYLAECKSWGGHSGSPTIWTQTMSVMQKTKETDVWLTKYLFGLLGLVSAHFDIPKRAKVTGDVLGQIETEINAGIAVITPAEAIRQLLMREDLVKTREERKKKNQYQKSMATLDIGRISGEGVTMEKFLDDLRKVSQKRPSPVKGQS